MFVVTLAVVSELGAKLASTDRGQASEVTVGSCFLSEAAVHFRRLMSRMPEVVQVMRIQGSRLACLLM